MTATCHPEIVLLGIYSNMQILRLDKLTICNSDIVFISYTALSCATLIVTADRSYDSNWLRINKLIKR